ncbi:alpha-L-rhamnosidase C-terminal domain-containing protein [Fibrella rubiginis]|uniref:alpha-L-rhamnosidase C-terminal domain-containing protein n=1 Tax=Fibrella rubiginis TaxID=2817060 RepID=UPI00286DB8A4|nr:alpha-L-rhamnosidase C-terminal domain-containing protein [Fibrella rubiginis]
MSLYYKWSASPVYEFLSTVCGINPAEPGFRSVRIEPFLGTLPAADGTMPHPNGDISVHFEKAPGGTLRGTVTLPPGLGGTLRWQGRSKALVAGRQEVSL